jgi:Zn-dependent protease
VLFPVDPLLRLRILGMQVGIRVSCLAGFLVVIGGVLSRIDGGLDPSTRRGTWITATTFAFLALLLAIAIHEIIRVQVSRRQGVIVRRVDLYLFGGSHEVIDDTTSPRSEAITALVALSSLFALSILTGAVAYAVRNNDEATSLPAKAIAISVIGITVIQSMPGLPLDGGRIFRAIWWYLADSAPAGTWAAGAYARVIAIGFIAGGLLLLGERQERSYWGAGLIIAGLQLLSATRGSAHRSAWQLMSRTLTLGDVSPRHFRGVSTATVIDDVIEQLVGANDDPVLLVRDQSGAFAGVLRISNLRGTRRGDWAIQPIGEVMTPIANLPKLSADLSVFDAVDALDAANQQVVVIIQSNADPVALSRTQLIHRLFERSHERR